MVTGRETTTFSQAQGQGEVVLYCPVAALNLTANSAGTGSSRMPWGARISPWIAATPSFVASRARAWAQTIGS